MRELAGERKRFGSPRLHIMLKWEGLVVNHKRTERIYREERLVLRRKRRRKGAAGARVIIPAPERPNRNWSMALHGRQHSHWSTLPSSDDRG